MYLNTEVKKEIFAQFGSGATDTGTPEAQIALFTYRINHLTGHLKDRKKDASSRMGLMRLVGKRRRLLDYLQRKDIMRYRKIVKDLGIRK